MTKPRVVITCEPPGPALARVFEQCHTWMWEQNRPMPRQLLLEKVADAEGLHTIYVDEVDQELLDAAPRLRVVSTYAVGVNNIDLQACTARGIRVGYAPGAVTESTADFAFALMLACNRRLVEGARYVREGRWREWSPDLMIGGDISGKTLGIVGMGRIGEAIARRAKGFDMNIIYHSRSPKPEAEARVGAAYRSLGALLGEADIVVLSLAPSPQSHHLINAAALAKMKPSATIVNVARGSVMDSQALYRALAGGRIRGAALDVTDPEPIPPDDPLLTLDNCLIVPHVGTAAWETRAAMTEISVSNLLNGLAGKAMPHCANPQTKLPD